jgi:hypothetical protein
LCEQRTVVEKEILHELGERCHMRLRLKARALTDRCWQGKEKSLCRMRRILKRLGGFYIAVDPVVATVCGDSRS